MDLLDCSDLCAFVSGLGFLLVFEDYTGQIQRQRVAHTSDSGALKGLRLHLVLVVPCVNTDLSNGLSICEDWPASASVLHHGFAIAPMGMQHQGFQTSAGKHGSWGLRT